MNMKTEGLKSETRHYSHEWNTLQLLLWIHTHVYVCIF